MIDLGVTESSSLRLLIFQALRQYSSKALLQFLEDPSSTVRCAAARELQVRGDKLAFDRAIRLLQSKTPVRREIAAFLLGQLGTPKFPFKAQSIGPLEDCAKNDEHAACRAAAIAGLGHLHAARAIPTLINASSAKDPVIRQATAFALSRFPANAMAKKCLARLRRDSEKSVARWATIGEFGARGLDS